MSVNNILNVSKSGIYAAQNTLQTVSHNIANANTPGYSRQTVALQNAPLGLGVQINDISRQLDTLLDRRQELGVGELGSLETKDRFLAQIEQIFNEADKDGLSVRLDSLYAAADNLVDNPTNPVGRAEFVTKADSTARYMQDMHNRLAGLLTPVDQEVDVLLADVNNRLKALRDINAVLSGSGSTDPSADLQDQRRQMVLELGKLIDIQTLEVPGGGLQIMMAGGQGLLADSVHAATLVRSKNNAVDPTFPVAPGTPPKLTNFRGITLDDRDVLKVQGGALGGLLEIRDTVINGKNGALTQLEALADEMRYQFNLIGSTAVSQGMYSSQTGVFSLGTDLGLQAMSDLSDDPLADMYAHSPADLSRVVDGEIVFASGADGDHLTTISRVTVRKGMTISQVLEAINEADAVDANVTADNRLQIQAANGRVYGVVSDSSHVLAALGIGALFGGKGAGDIALNPVLADDSRQLGVGKMVSKKEDLNDPTRVTNVVFNDGDNQAALAVSRLRTTKFEISGRTASLTGSYAATVGMLGAVINQNKESLTAQQAAQTFIGQMRESTSGVSMEEELTDLMRFQRAFQASSKMVSTADELMQTIINMV
ncbi:MAG: flagellar hook-associated protein FlgK [Magnetococcales bacterium]|nr:flagellar hook-associated protein FlgK [Magnetococcales bacterium]